jgi:zinc protease
MTFAQTKRSVPGPEDITRVVLDNGIVVLVRENHAAPVVVVEGLLPTGSIHDPAGKTGLAGFVASMLMRGSERYSFDEFNEIIEGVGANLSVSASDHTTDFGSTSLAEDFPTMVEVLADTLHRPLFPPEHITRVRSQKLVRIQERDQDTQQVANLRFYETIYGDHPYGRPTSGYAETVSAIQREDLLAFHAGHYAPQGAVIVVSGDVETEAAIDLIRAQFEDWRGDAAGSTAEQPVEPVKTAGGVNRLFYPLPGKYQSDIVIGCPAVARSHPDYYAVRVANTVLGRFGMMGRLGEKIREEQGLAYYAFSSQDANLAAGVWLAAAGVNPENVDVAVESILSEFARLGEEPPSEEELSDSQAFMTGVLPLTLETNEGVANTLLNMEWYGLGLDYIERYNDLIYGVSPADVQRVAAAYLRSDRYAAVVAGPPNAG